MVSYACAFSQSELGKYFEWIIIQVMGANQNTQKALPSDLVSISRTII